MQSGKAHVQEVLGHAAENQNQNKPSWISAHEVLQSWLIDIVYHLLGKNKKGKGGGAYYWEGAYFRGEGA